MEPYIWPKWLVPQFRHEARDGYSNKDLDREGQQQVLRAMFRGIRDGVRELLVRVDALVRKSHETHDMKVKDEMERLLKEYDKLKDPWVFVS